MSTIDTIDAPICRRAEEGNSLPQRPRRNLFLALWRWFSELPARRMSRRGLMELTDDQLRDIGITRAQARRGSLKPFWD